MNNDDVHKTHCCSEHGCKYGDEFYPVFNGTVEQEYPCEECKPHMLNDGREEPFLRFGSSLDGVDDAIMELLRLSELDYDSFLEVKEVIEIYFSRARNKNIN